MSYHSTSSDLVIVGGGPAGYVAAIRAAQLGAAVTLIEERDIGGVCLNLGCIPTKSLLRSSEVASLVARSKEFGVPAEAKQADWGTIFSRKNRVVKGLRSGVEHLMAANKITVLRGTGRMLDPETVVVDDLTSIKAKRILLATGSRPSIPPIPGIDLPGVITSDQALELAAPPKALLIIGAGVIGVEFATFFRQLGVAVTMVDQADQILPDLEPDLASELHKVMRRQGVQMRLSAKVLAITQSMDGKLKASIEQSDGIIDVEADTVLVATGRTLRSSEAGIPAQGIATGRGAIIVNDRMETNLAGVYAAGDVTGGWLLAHVAFVEGRTAAENALGKGQLMDYSAVPACIYTHPEIATVGLTERFALQTGRRVKIGRFDFRSNGKALGIGDRDGFAKVIVDADDHTVLGGQIIGAGATDLISELTLAIRLKAPAEVLAELIHPHPTLSEVVMEAAADAIGRAIHK